MSTVTELETALSRSGQEITDLRNEQASFEQSYGELKMHRKVLQKEISSLEGTLESEKEYQNYLLRIMMKHGYNMEDVEETLSQQRK